MKLGRYAAVTDTGRRRFRNEDAYISEPPLFAIADGMGGARAGEIASGLAAAALEEARARAHEEGELETIIAEANRRIWERSLADPATAGMGTTITVALVDAEAESVLFGHVGDSRAYRLRDGQLEQVTTDHSLVAELVENGVLTPEEAEHHPQRSAITRALGTEPAVEADIFSVAVSPGDLFLLCSDGLSDMLSADEITSIVEAAGRDPRTAGRALVAAANANGGEDNVTVVLFEVVSDDTVVEDPGEDTAIGAPAPEGDGRAPEPDADDEPRRHGAGKGGRLAAVVLIAALLAMGVLALYWGITR